MRKKIGFVFIGGFGKAAYLYFRDSIRAQQFMIIEKYFKFADPYSNDYFIYGDDTSNNRKLLEEKLINVFYESVRANIVVVFMGGGVSSSNAICDQIIRVLKEHKTINVFITTLPDYYEGRKRRKTAEEYSKVMSQHFDYILVFDNAVINPEFKRDESAFKLYSLVFKIMSKIMFNSKFATILSELKKQSLDGVISINRLENIILNI